MNEKLQDFDSVVQDSTELKTTLPDSEQHIRLAGYHDLHLIAEGTSGVVYCARRDSDNRTVAVKIYRKELMPNAEAVTRFQHEVSTLKRLNHPNIVKILGSGTTDAGQSYLEMENVEGQNLRKILEENGAFSPKRAATVAREVCRALTAAHENGIIHRDLKPSNIILDEQNIAKVVDFGIAKAVGTSNDTITEYGSIIGTPAYMSPEQCLNQRVDQRSDVYSLGCTLFELLTSEKAFDAETAMTALAKQINKDRSHLKPILDKHNVPIELQEILTRCLERNPDSRYNSAAELDHALSGYLLQIQQSPVSKWQMNTGTQLILCVLALASILVIFETTLFHARESIEADPGHPLPTSNAVVGNSGSKEAVKIDIKNRQTGAVIFSETAPGLTVKKAVQHAAQQQISLAYADLANAQLSQIQLSNIDLQGANLTDANFTQAQLDNDKFDGAILTKANFGQCRFNRCTFRNAKMSSSYLVQAVAPYTDFRDADLSQSNLVQAHLTNCDLRSAILTGANCSQTEFTGSNITDTVVPLTNRFSSPNFKGCIMHGVRIN